jgi:hypothetical protein
MTIQGLAERQKIEVQYWQQSLTEGPNSDLFLDFLKKAGDARILLDLVARYRALFEGAATVLELGGGQGRQHVW